MDAIAKAKTVATESSRINEARLFRWFHRIREAYYNQPIMPLGAFRPSDRIELRTIDNAEYEYLLKLKAAVADTSELEAGNSNG